VLGSGPRPNRADDYRTAAAYAWRAVRAAGRRAPHPRPHARRHIRMPPGIAQILQTRFDQVATILGGRDLESTSSTKRARRCAHRAELEKVTQPSGVRGWVARRPAALTARHAHEAAVQ